MMAVDEKALLRTPEQVSPGSRHGFAGRGVLVSGLQEASKRSTSDDILASRYVLETAMQLVRAKEKLEAYEFVIIEQAAYISQARASKPAAAPAYSPQKPINEEEAILSAIAKIGLQPRLKAKRTAPSGNFVFSIEIDGDVCSVMLPKDVMSREDPVACAEEFARNQGIKTRTEATKQMLERRRASRPDIPAINALGIDASDLEKRGVTFEGQQNGLCHFTYIPEEIAREVGTTFTIPNTFQGKSLLAELDRKIFSVHVQFKQPFIPRILEEGMSSVKATPRIQSIAQGDVKAIAKALDVLACGTEIGEEMVPPEYREAWSRVKETREYQEYATLFNRGVLTRDEAAAFMENLGSVAHPTVGIAKAWLKMNMQHDGTLSAPDAAAFKDMLERSEANPEGVCERALRNLAEAYALLTGDARAISYDMETLESRYLEMSLRIRKASAEILPPHLMKLVE